MTRLLLPLLLLASVAGCDTPPCREKRPNWFDNSCDNRARIVIENGVAICRCPTDGGKP